MIMRVIIQNLVHSGNGMTMVPEYMTIFQKKHKNGVIDVWWLYDDGGDTDKPLLYLILNYSEDNVLTHPFPISSFQV